jgi:toxoflavin synthase
MLKNKNEVKAKYDAISNNYTELVKTDPVKKLHYQSALKLLGDVSGLKILDVGCGNGAFDRNLAHAGAIVIGYDISAKQIGSALKAEEAKRLGIKYTIADPAEFKTNQKFEKAVSILVLHYAINAEHLEKFFSSTSQVLKNKGQFVCILSNPNFKRLNKKLYNRCFRKIGNSRMKVDFLDSKQNISCSAEYSDFSTSDYEKASLSCGFHKFKWASLKPTPESLMEMGEKYWESFEGDCPYIGFIAYK